jgi:hypothetical protein
MNRAPVGIIILGFFALVNGIGAAIVGLRQMGIVAFGPLETGSGVFFSGVLTLIIGVFYIALAYAAWDMRPWAWLYGNFIAMLGLFTSILVLLSTGSVATGLAAALLPGVILWYLNTPAMRGAFEAAEAGRFGTSNDYERDKAQAIMAERADDRA